MFGLFDSNIDITEDAALKLTILDEVPINEPNFSSVNNELTALKLFRLNGLKKAFDDALVDNKGDADVSKEKVKFPVV